MESMGKVLVGELEVLRKDLLFLREKSVVMAEHEVREILTGIWARYLDVMDRYESPDVRDELSFWLGMTNLLIEYNMSA